jgi:hypothetical protein
MPRPYCVFCREAADWISPTTLRCENCCSDNEAAGGLLHVGTAAGVSAKVRARMKADKERANARQD